ncbi:hypothetical protein ACQEXU_21195 [Vibrio sp. TRT 21S02]|nr:hypothetical protein [Vibrio sinaloensis]
MKNYFSILVLLVAVEAYGGNITMWPDLTSIKYVSDRVANEKDVGDGSAVFLLQSEGKSIGSPIPIEIPQYAFHTNLETGEKRSVVVIQAEEANGQKVVGAIDIQSNGFMVGLLFEFDLLGTKPPR